MNAPWVTDVRHFEALDKEEARDHALERISSFIAADPLILADSLAALDADSPLMHCLCSALAAIWTRGMQATPAQSLVLATAVQGIADERAKVIYDRIE